jgi:hypothetical protein
MSFMPRTAKKGAIVFAATVAASGCLAGAAQATSIAITATPNPATPGATITLTNTGATSEAMPEPSTLIYDYWEPNTAPCANTAANERNTSHGNGGLATIEQKSSPSFNDQTSFVLKVGVHSYRIRAYIYTGGDDSVAPEAVATTLLSIPPTRAELLAAAIKKCHKKNTKARRAKCIKAAKKLYAPKK